MRSNELRIGNYIQNSHGFISRVGIIMAGGIYDYNPIPLTEEWLVKFGFVFKGMGISGAVCIRHSGHWYKNNNPYFAGTKKPFDIFLQYGQGVDIGYIHQLQNLYFALTNEELTWTN